MMIICCLTRVRCQSLQTLIIKADAIKFTYKLRVYSLNNNSMDSSTEYGIPESNKYRQHLTKGEYLPTGSNRKIKLLLQHSLRYSYRKRCCKCCPTILCELLFPIILIALLALIHYRANAFLKEMNVNSEPVLRGLNHRTCSQNINSTTTLSNDLLKKCFKFPSSYSGRGWISFESETIFNKINLVLSSYGK
ncbi:unnamed protein product [Rotaria sp. Silwood2]|nr:unnamed protein product [Rotaria sp. Silwood2]CAF4389180.1 unnamed protein product [Rotaria sp. Silwood2]